MTKKPLLRYGFQKTGPCKDFEKAFLCVRKCLDLKYDVAYSDKNCACTCYTKPEKAQYTIKYEGQTKTDWKLGAPTTHKPYWAQPKSDPEETEAPQSDENGDDDSTTSKKEDCVKPKDDETATGEPVEPGNEGATLAGAEETEAAHEAAPEDGHQEGETQEPHAEGEAEPGAEGAPEGAPEGAAEGADGAAPADAEGGGEEAPAEK